VLLEQEENCNRQNQKMQWSFQPLNYQILPKLFLS